MRKHRKEKDLGGGERGWGVFSSRCEGKEILGRLLGNTACPRWFNGKESICRKWTFDPCVGKICGKGNGNPLQFLIRIVPWTEEPGGLQSVGSHWVRHYWADWAWLSDWACIQGPCWVTSSLSTSLATGNRRPNTFIEKAQLTGVQAWSVFIFFQQLLSNCVLCHTSPLASSSPVDSLSRLQNSFLSLFTTETVSLQYQKLQDRRQLWLQQLGDEGRLGWGWVLNCPPQAYKSCARPALRQKKEPRVSNRVTDGLMDGGTCVFEVRS